MIPNSTHYWLRNAHVPQALVVRGKGRSQEWVTNEDGATRDGLLGVDIEIREGAIASLATAGMLTSYNAPSVDLQGRMVFPCFVDLHTHLDKGHMWDRNPNPDGTFDRALATLVADSDQNWTPDDLYHRMTFGLKCSYAHGTKAIRTHLDSGGKLAKMSFEVFQTLREEWRDRLILQPACLVSLDYFLTPEGEKLADRVAAVGGVLGGVAFLNPDIEAQIDRAFALAKDRNLNLDFHTDETHDPASNCLNLIAKATQQYAYQERVVCGHCCSLAMQPSAVARSTIQAVQQAKIGIVSLPLCNLFLQDRHPGQTPRWRGITLLHELKQAGVPVAVSSDNCRDPFHGYGDHDALEVFSWSTKIAHLDRPYSDWCRIVTSTPADLMGLPTVGRIGVGLPADLVLFKARRYSELLARSQRDRTVLRSGKAIDTTLPDYADLDPFV